MQNALQAKSSPLVAGMAAVCVATAVSGVAPLPTPQALQAAHAAAPAVATYAEKYYLTGAAESLLTLASIPFNDFKVLFNAVMAVPNAIIGPIDAATVALFNANPAEAARQLTLIVPTLISSITHLIQTPGALLAQNLATLGGLFGVAGAATGAAALKPLAASATIAAPTAALPLLTLASIPFYDAKVLFNAVMAVPNSIIAPIDAATVALFNANPAEALHQLAGIVQGVIKSIVNLIQTPGKLLAENIATIGGLFSGAAAGAAVTPLAAGKRLALAAAPAAGVTTGAGTGTESTGGTAADAHVAKTQHRKRDTAAEATAASSTGTTDASSGTPEVTKAPGKERKHDKSGTPTGTDSTTPATDSSTGTPSGTSEGDAAGTTGKRAKTHDKADAGSTKAGSGSNDSGSNDSGSTGSTKPGSASATKAGSANPGSTGGGKHRKSDSSGSSSSPKSSHSGGGKHRKAA